jgi:Flp pilus assembly pilin Flp
MQHEMHHADLERLAVPRPPAGRPLAHPAPARLIRRRGDGERGSQTMEYALIMIVVATVATLAVTWARQGAIKSLFDAVMTKVLDLFGIGG